MAVTTCRRSRRRVPPPATLRRRESRPPNCRRSRGTGAVVGDTPPVPDGRPRNCRRSRGTGSVVGDASSSVGRWTSGHRRGDAALPSSRQPRFVLAARGRVRQKTAPPQLADAGAVELVGSGAAEGLEVAANIGSPRRTRQAGALDVWRDVERCRNGANRRRLRPPASPTRSLRRMQRVPAWFSRDGGDRSPVAIAGPPAAEPAVQVRRCGGAVDQPHRQRPERAGVVELLARRKGWLVPSAAPSVPHKSASCGISPPAAAGTASAAEAGGQAVVALGVGAERLGGGCDRAWDRRR